MELYIDNYIHIHIIYIVYIYIYIDDIFYDELHRNDEGNRIVVCCYDTFIVITIYHLFLIRDTNVMRLYIV